MYNSPHLERRDSTISETDGADGVTRRRLLAATAAGSTMGGLAGCAGTDDNGDGDDSGNGDGSDNGDGDDGNGDERSFFDPGPTVAVETIAEGLLLPNVFAVPPHDDRLFIGDQQGIIYVHEDGQLRDEPFLDLRDRVIDLGTDLPTWVSADERGLLGLAFHPEFADNGLFYVRYSTPAGDVDADHREILSEFSVTDGGNADPNSERVLLDIPWLRPLHQAGGLAFGPDGYLYTSFGDGLNPSKGQNVSNNLNGSVVRLDVDERDGDLPYGIPDDNPLVDEEGRDEYYAWGFRNPYRIGFDDGMLTVGDVGQELFEEITVVERGTNHGWAVKEGSSCHNPAQPGVPPNDCPDVSERGDPFVDPVAEFPHFDDDRAVGFAVVGGNVYRGDEVSELRGEYLFGIYTRSFTSPSGRLIAATPDGDTWPMREVRFATLAEEELDINVLSLGRDNDGEMYILGTNASLSEGFTSRNAGRVYRIVEDD
ncbi:MAG: glucose/arabinose dehydrogenase [Natronomonas sp.]|jgi:glucose/arabinose dehydrogenase